MTKNLFTKVVTASDVCGDWEPYKDEYCFKVFKEEGLHSWEEAEKTCEQNGAHLINIKLKEEQEFVQDYLFTKNKIVNNVWIGAKHSVNNKFLWKDGEELKFTNWAKDYPKNFENTCVQMHSDQDSVGKWLDEDCGKGYQIACQKRQILSIAKIQDILLEDRQLLMDTIRKQAEYNSQLEQKLAETNQKLATIVPIGFIYAQLPNEKEPKEIWPSMSWSEVSSNYNGTFFRVSGGDAAPFGTAQPDNTRQLEEVITHFNHLLIGDYEGWNQKPYSIPRAGWSVSFHTGSNYEDKNNVFINFKNSAGEVRPRNMAMKIWKRTA